MARTAEAVGRLAARRLKVAFELPSLSSTLKSTLSGVAPGLQSATNAYQGAKNIYSGVKSFSNSGGVKPVTPLGGNNMRPFQQPLQAMGGQFQQAMGDKWTPELNQAWGQILGTHQPQQQTKTEPSFMQSVALPAQAFFGGAGRLLGRPKNLVQGAVGTGTGLLGWGVGAAGEALAGKGGTFSALKDSGRTAATQGAGQVAGNVVGGVNDLARYGHSWAPTIAQHTLPEGYAKQVEQGYKDWWGDEPGKGWADQAENYASGGRSHSQLNPLSEGMRYKSDNLRRIANTPQARQGVGMERLEANLYDTFAHPDHGMFGIASGGLALPGGGAASRLGSMALDQLSPYIFGQ